MTTQKTPKTHKIKRKNISKTIPSSTNPQKKGHDQNPGLSVSHIFFVTFSILFIFVKNVLNRFELIKSKILWTNKIFFQAMFIIWSNKRIFNKIPSLSPSLFKTPCIKNQESRSRRENPSEQWNQILLLLLLPPFQGPLNHQLKIFKSLSWIINLDLKPQYPCWSIQYYWQYSW